MTNKAKKLGQLARLAQIRSDAELKRFAAFRAHVDAAAARRDQMREQLAGVYARTEAFSLAEARLANQEAGRLARRAAQLETELERLRPGFEAARQKAAREFGRVQVLKQLAKELRVAGRRGG